MAGVDAKEMNGDATAAEVLAELQRQRSAVVNSFLWVFLGLAVATVLINAVLSGSEMYTFAALLPNVLLVGTVLFSMWLNRRGMLVAATLLTSGLILVAAVLVVLVVGIEGNAVVLVLFFLPLVMAGMLLGRLALATIAAISMAAVTFAPLFHGNLPASLQEATDSTLVLSILQFDLVFVAVTFLLDRFGFRYQATLKTLLRARVEAELSARREMEFSHAVVESLPGLFYMRDGEGSLVRWNAEVERVTGYSREEIAELAPLELFAPEEMETMAGKLREVHEVGSSSQATRIRTKDGASVPYLLSAVRAPLNGSKYSVVVGIDRTEIDAAQRRIDSLNVELARRLDRMAALREIDRAIIGSLDIDLTLGVVLDQVRGRLEVPAARILLYDNLDRSLRFGASQGLGDNRQKSLRLRLGEGPAGRAALERETVVIQASEVQFDNADHVNKLDGYVAVPLVAKGRLQGVLEIFHAGAVPEAHEWHDFLDALAVQTAIALESVTLFEGLERSNIELRQAYDTTIEGWSRALDLKDEETEGHSRRVTELCVQLAAKLDISGDMLVHIRRGALLHDIGKMGVPDRILLKPGKLDPDEWEVMKRHTTYAYELLSKIPFLRSALDIPYAHHERWDGSGYPRSLSGEQIPLTARLFAVVDVYDALTSNRPYREAWSEERALAHIRAGSGSHFDPDIVEAFFEMVNEPQVSPD